MMPNESGAVTMAVVLLMWSLAVLVFLGLVIWSRAHPKAVVRFARRHSFQRPPQRTR
jgi:hypothetical protein